MATLTKEYTFAAGPAVSAEVNQNFDDIVAFINTNCMQKDGSLAFDVIPALPASDPTTANQATRKSYVDTAVATVAATAAGAVTTAGTAASTAASALAGLAAKVSFTDMANSSPADGGTVSGVILLKAGYNEVGVDGDGDCFIDFGTNFPHGIIAAVANLRVAAGTINVLQTNYAVSATTLDGFKVRLYKESTGASVLTGIAGIEWIAVGW